MTTRRWTSLALLVGVMALAIPCASCSKENRKPVFPARGRVLLESRPVPGAFVVFHPVGADESNPRRPYGWVDKEGWYTLTTYNANDGAPAGEYDVTVEWRQSAPSDEAGEEAEGINVLPERYSKPGTSGLRRHIREGDNELPPIELKK